MARKYIKDKQGKFQGSLPDANSRPEDLPELPRLPKRASTQPTNKPTAPVQHPAARAWERVQLFDRLTRQINEVKTTEKETQVFSSERKQAKAKRLELEAAHQNIKRELNDKCWRCYGTGKPLNGQGDTMEIFESCPECNNPPLPARPPSW